MTKLTIGRVGLDFDLDGVTRWEHDGDRLSIRVEVYSTLAQALVVRQQILGYVDSPDEDPFVPVTWSEEPEADGYYFVDSASVTPDTVGRDVFTLDVRLTRVAGFTTPIIELLTLAANRPAYQHLSEFVTPVASVGIPRSARDVARVNPVTNQYVVDLDPKIRVGEGALFTGGGGSGNHLVVIGGVRSTQYWVAPSSYYDGAATLTVDGNIVVGRQIRNRPLSFQISNGLVRVSVMNDPGDFRISVETWVAGAWSAPLIGRMKTGLTSSRINMVDPHSIAVIENNPGRVTVRLVTATGLGRPLIMDLTIRRGFYGVYCRFQAPTDTSYPSITFEDGQLASVSRYRGGYYLPSGAVAATNLVLNPQAGLIASGGGWSAVGGTLDGRQVGAAISGVPRIVTFVRATATAAHADVDFGVSCQQGGSMLVTAGNTYNFSAYGRVSVSRNIRLRIRFFDGASAQVGADVLVGGTTPGANTWVRLTSSQVVPVGAVRAGVAIVGGAGAAWAVGHVLDMTGVQVTLGAVMADYFDGDSDASGPVSTYWAGAEHASVSNRSDTAVGATGYFIMSPDRIGKTGNEFYPDDGAGGIQSNLWDFAFGINPDRDWDYELENYMSVVNVRESVAIR